MSESPEVEQAVLEWIQSFPSAGQCDSIQQLCDGVILWRVLNELDPDHFDLTAADLSPGDNWVLSRGNISALLRHVGDFFNTKREDAFVDLVNVEALVKDANFDELVIVLELVSAVAMHSDAKEEVVARIFSMSTVAQGIVRELVERGFRHLGDTVEGDDDVSRDLTNSFTRQEDVVDINNSEEKIRSLEVMVSHIHENRINLEKDIQSLERHNETLRMELKRIESRLREVEIERDTAVTTERENVERANSMVEQLKSYLAETREELSRREGDGVALRVKIQNLSSELETALDIKKRLESEKESILDELDIVRHRLAESSRAEATVAQYRKYFENYVNLEAKNRDLESQLSSLTERLATVEAQHSKAVATLKSTTEHYEPMVVTIKNDLSVALKRAKIAEESSASAWEELAIMRRERTRLESEVMSLRSDASGGETDDQFLNTVMQKRCAEVDNERLRSENDRLKAELDSLRQQISCIPSSPLSSIPRMSPISIQSPVSVHDLNAVEIDIAGQQAYCREIIELQTDNKAMADDLRHVRNQLSEAVNHLRDSDQRNATLQQQLADQSAKLETIIHKAREIEKENSVLKSQREILNNYVSQHLEMFRENIQSNMQPLKHELAIARNTASRLRSEIDARVKEEKILSSAMFGMGVRFLDHTLNTTYSKMPISGGAVQSQVLKALNETFQEPDLGDELSKSLSTVYI